MNFEAFTREDAKTIVARLRMALSQEAFDELVAKYGAGSIDQYQAFIAERLNDDTARAALVKWYGGKEKAMASVNDPPRDLQPYQKDIHGIYEQLSRPTGEDRTAETKWIAQLADCYKGMFHMDNARALLLDLATGYLQDERLREANDAVYGTGSAERIAAAITRYYGV